MATDAPFNEGLKTWIGDPVYPPYRVGDPPPYQPWIEPYPYPYPTQPLVWPPIKTVTTTGGDLLGIKKREARIKELEALLQMAHDELLCGDDDDALAVCELIEDCLSEGGD